MKTRRRNKKPIEKTSKQLRVDADREFSLYIRLRDANEYGIVECCTCGKRRHYKDQMECGHYVKRNHESTRYDEKNCNTQCKECNNFGKGEEAKHRKFIDKKYGEGTADQLTLKGREFCFRKIADYIAIKEHYKIKRKQLQEELT